jgi:hypothetical protein
MDDGDDIDDILGRTQADDGDGPDPEEDYYADAFEDQ